MVLRTEPGKKTSNLVSKSRQRDAIISLYTRSEKLNDFYFSFDFYFGSDNRSSSSLLRGTSLIEFGPIDWLLLILFMAK